MRGGLESAGVVLVFGFLAAPVGLVFDRGPSLLAGFLSDEVSGPVLDGSVLYDSAGDGEAWSAGG